MPSARNAKCSEEPGVQFCLLPHPLLKADLCLLAQGVFIFSLPNSYSYTEAPSPLAPCPDVL